MFRKISSIKVLWIFVICTVLGSASLAQNKSGKKNEKGKPVMWERVNVSRQDLFLGPGGSKMQPNLKRITLIKKESGGTSLKYRIKDGSGRVWVAKIDKESQPETVSVRLIWALGYKSEINYLVPKLTIPGKGTYENVRLEARPENVDRKERWSWEENPFIGTNEFQGLKIMMAFLNNWDLKQGNTMILKQGDELHYIISDLGATFGDYGSNNWPIVWRLGRSINRPAEYRDSSFIDGVDNGKVDFAFKGKGRKMLDDVSVKQARWLTNLLLQLSDKQIRDAFRAANYKPDEIKMLASAVKGRISELDRVTSQNLAENK